MKLYYSCSVLYLLRFFKNSKTFYKVNIHLDLPTFTLSIALHPLLYL